MKRAIQRKQWRDAIEISHIYSTKIQVLTHASELEAPVAELERLSLLHRRSMRQMSNLMDAIKDDMASLESGVKRLRRSKQLLQ